MIEKIVSGDLTLRPDFANIKELASKINEIIDHLPQEKEPQPVPPTLCDACHREIYAEGEPTKEYPLCPRCKTPTVAGAHMTSNDKRSLYCVNGNCTYDVPFEELTTPILKPTKEVPDIRGILLRLSIDTVSGEYDIKFRNSLEKRYDNRNKLIDQAIQEISALYRKDV